MPAPKGVKQSGRGEAPSDIIAVVNSAPSLTERIRAIPWSRLAVPVSALILLGIWARLTPEGLLGKADAIGYSVCHRIDARSFHLGDRPLPLCSRCTGMYLGAAISLIGFQALGRQGAGKFPAGKMRIGLAIFIAAFLVDSLNSVLQLFPGLPHLYLPQNELRLATGLLGGIALGTYVYAAFQQTVWKDWRSEPVLAGGRDLAILLGVAGVLYVAVTSENPLLLYPLAIASGLSVLGLLTVVFGVLTLTLTRRENQMTRWRGLALPFAGGLALALVQIGGLDLIRYALTRTWGGFTL
jgi:uncharacterized membrane protein